MVFAPPMEGELSYEEIAAQKSTFNTWNFSTEEFSATGYEDLEDTFKALEVVPSEYLALPEADREKMIDVIFDIYRSRNIFPIRYFSTLGVQNELMKALDHKSVWKGDSIRSGVGIGTAVCNFLFPNLAHVASLQDFTPDKKGAEDAYGKFMSDNFLRKAIHFCLGYQPGPVGPGSLYSGLRMVGSSPTNFLPMNAKGIFERFCPYDDGVIWDYACGFGGRMLGALSSERNYKYIGTDPNVETMYNLHRLGKHIESVTGREDSYELHCVGSEKMIGPEESIDFAFASPPYFNLEIYSSDITQSYNEFPDLAGWLEGYVRPTIRNINRMLKAGRSYAVNIADFKIGGDQVQFVDAWKSISEQEGLPYYTTLYLDVAARAGTKLQAAGEQKKENIMVFQKPGW